MPEPIELFFLGTGAAVPTPNRHQPAIILRYKGDYILFDCGEGTQLQLQKMKISPMKISKICITHWHADHFAGLLPLIETLHLSRRKEPLEIFGPDASRFVDSLLEMSYWGVGFKVIAKECGNKDTEKLFSGDGYDVFALRVKHSVPATGYMFLERDYWNINPIKAKQLKLTFTDMRMIKEKGFIKSSSRNVKLEQVAKRTVGRKVVYSGDTIAYEPFFKSASGADLMIHDATFAEPHPGRFHPSVGEVARMAKKYRIKQLVLTHLSKMYRDEASVLQTAKKIFPKVLMAKDLTKIVVK